MSVVCFVTRQCNPEPRPDPDRRGTARRRVPYAAPPQPLAQPQARDARPVPGGSPFAVHRSSFSTCLRRPWMTWCVLVPQVIRSGACPSLVSLQVSYAQTFADGLALVRAVRSHISVDELVRPLLFTLLQDADANSTWFALSCNSGGASRSGSRRDCTHCRPSTTSARRKRSLAASGGRGRYANATTGWRAKRTARCAGASSSASRRTCSSTRRSTAACESASTARASERSPTARDRIASYRLLHAFDFGLTGWFALPYLILGTMGTLLWKPQHMVAGWLKLKHLLARRDEGFAQYSTVYCTAVLYSTGQSSCFVKCTHCVG